MHLSEEQRFNQALIKLAVLFYQVDRKILLSEQDYLEELVESLEWDSPICREAYVNEVGAVVREKIDVRRFVRFELGEGIEKEENDFAAEVAAASQV